ncbi:hypothetical protein BMF94_1811 [Rhodotorula taiwanensis]|uniref:Uncharacterized protein n=1 Tax=Rhodotorula taiwanensis TaxID=741276 RepID=A0A2S5BEI2_9BASI|nr:hypothetical protein BMF94_1811 [Rhodotorula taiwanensis]
MKDWTILVISLSVISAVLILASCLATARLKYRRSRETTEEEKNATPPIAGSPWLSASPGPNGSAQYLRGWFALDGASNGTGWSRDDLGAPSYAPTGQDEDAQSIREPHFSRAQRAAQRANKLLRRNRNKTDSAAEGQPAAPGSSKRKNKPRTSRTTAAALLEASIASGAQDGKQLDPAVVQKDAVA